MCKLPDRRDWQWEKLSLALVGRVLLNKALIRLSADGWGCAPSLVVVWPEATQSWALQALWEVSRGLMPRPSWTATAGPTVSPCRPAPPQKTLQP